MTQEKAMVSKMTAHRQATQPGSEPLDYYVVEVTFKGLPDANERQGFLDLPTRFSLPDTDVDRLREVANRILYSRQEFQRLVRDLGATLPGSKREPASSATP
jgi:hypothetical protein